MAPDPPIQNRRITKIRPLSSPKELRHQLPMTSQQERAVVRDREAVASILHGTDDRLSSSSDPARSTTPPPVWSTHAGWPTWPRTSKGNSVS